MTNHSVNGHMSDDNQLCDGPTTFPYLLTLDEDTGLLDDEQLEVTALEEEPKESPPNLSVTTPTTNLITAAFATTPFTANAPTNVNTGTESTHLINDTLTTLRNRLAEAQKEIAELRHIAYQNEMRALEQGVRIIAMENTISQLINLYPITGNTNHEMRNPITQAAQHGKTTHGDTGTKATNYKRKFGESSNHSLTQPKAKRAKTVQTYAAEPKMKTYKGNKPFCSPCNCHHTGPCGAPRSHCKRYGHQTKDCKVKTCFECGNAGHFRIERPKLNNNSRQNP